MNKDSTGNLKQDPAQINIKGLGLYIEDYLIQFRRNPLTAVCSNDAGVEETLQLLKELKPEKPVSVYLAATKAAERLYRSSHTQKACDCDFKKLTNDIKSLKLICDLGMER